MKEMFRRALAVFLCGCMLAGSLPETVMAAEETRSGADASGEARETETREAEAESETQETEAESETQSEEDTVQPDADVPDTEAPGTVQPDADAYTSDAGIAPVSQEEEAAAPVIKEVQECGYYIAADVEIVNGLYGNLYWKEKEGDGWKQAESATSSVSGAKRFLCRPTKPGTAYVLQLRAGTNDNAQVYDEQEITTTDYKFQASATVTDITAASARIEVLFEDYQGLYPDYSSAWLRAGTEYTDIFGSAQEQTGSATLSQKSQTSDRISLNLSNLKAGTEYTVPVWVAESTTDKKYRKKLTDITFTTSESAVGDKLQFEAAADETDKTRINFTISPSDTDGLTESAYSWTVAYCIKGAPAGERRTEAGYLTDSAQYKTTGSLTGLYAGTDYVLTAAVDGVLKTVEVSTESDGVTPRISLSPLSFGGKLSVALEGVSENTDSCYMSAYVKTDGNSWYSMYPYDQSLTSENNWSGEWLIYTYKIEPGFSYDVKVVIQNQDYATISQKYFTLVTPAISTEVKAGEIAGREAVISCELEQPDECFDARSPEVSVYYRKKGADSAWEKASDTISLQKDSEGVAKGSMKLSRLAVNTEYEVKVTSCADEAVVYGTTEFRTTEGMTEGAFSDLNMEFSGFGIYISGTYKPSDYADKTELYLVETDSAGGKVAETKLSDTSSIYVNDALRQETASVRIKALETLEEKDAAGNAVQKEYFSEEYKRDNAPKDVSFSISNAGTGVTSFHADLTYAGDMGLAVKDSQGIEAALYYKTAEETVEKSKTDSAYFSKDEKTKRFTFGGLTENTVYQGRLVVFVESRLYDAPVKVYEQEIPLESFTTKENKTYQAETAFPDERLREMVLQRANATGKTEVTAAQLEKITRFDAGRDDFGTAPVRDLTGIELLTELTYLNLDNNEVSDTPSVDWSRLANLKSLNLTGNELTKIPDLSGNQELEYVYLKENQIPAEEFETVSARLPKGVTLDKDTQASQRVGGLQVIAEETYYQRAGKSPLLIRVKGYKSGLPYTFRYTVDGNELEFLRTAYTPDGSIPYNPDTGLAAGEHTLTVEMLANGEKQFEQEVTFRMAEGGAFLQKPLYRFHQRTRDNSITTYSDKKVSAAYLQKGDSAVMADLDIYSYPSCDEYRYHRLSSDGIYLDGLEVYRGSVSLAPIKNKTPDAGIYDLRLVYEDNTEETIAGAVEIIGSAVISGGNIGYDYDSTGSFFYLSIDGYGFDASKLNYAFTHNGKPQTAEYVNAKETSGGCIVKFRKADTWEPKEGDEVTVKLSPAEGYDVILDRDAFTAYVSQGIYYCAYNEVSNKIEVGVTSNLKRENVTFRLTRYQDYSNANNGTNVLETIEVSPETVTETISRLVPMKEGVVLQLPSGYYRLDMTCGGYKDHETFYYSNSNYWSGAQYVGAAKQSFYYFSEIPYAGKDGAKDFRAELTGGELTAPLQPESVWTYSYAGDAFTAVGMTYDCSALTPGAYTITLYHKEEKLSEYTVTALPVDKFVITRSYSPSASWIDDSSFRVSCDTVNTAETDAFTVSLTDIFGKEVGGLKTEVTSRSSGSVSLTVTGLRKEDAYKYYYIKVTHNTLGEAYQPDRETKFFTDQRGKYTQIYDSDLFSDRREGGRQVGVNLYDGIVFPVTVEIYKPYDTDLITAVVINQEDLEDKNANLNLRWYYFKETLTEALPDKDALYQIIASDANGQTEYWRNPIGVSSSIAGAWTVTPKQLNLNLDSDETRTGILTVEGNKGNPAFKSENPEVCTVAVDKTDKNRAVVTAVAEGTASISITADKTTQKVTVTVTKEPVKPTGISIEAPESAAAGSKVEISAFVTPAGAWNKQSSITWTSSDSSVISIPEGSRGLVIEADALKAGSAVVTAALDGTELTASRTIEVVKEVSDEEQDELVKELGTLYFLEGADTSLADIRLPDGWSWEEPAQKPAADNSHPIQDFRASYNKDDISFERYLDVHVSKLESVRIVGDATVKAGKESLYIGDYNYIGQDPGNGYEIGWKWTPGQKLTAGTDTGRQLAVTVTGDDTLALSMTITNKSTGKTVSGEASFKITAGEIPDSEPTLENKKITVYKNSTRHVPIGLVAKDGNSITAVKPDNADFRTEKDENGEWLIWLAKGDNYTKKTKVTLNLTVTTASGTDYQKTLGVTVDVTEITTKNVKFKQTLKPNAAYSDTSVVRAEFTVSSKYIIEDIKAVKDGGKFAVKSYDAASGKLVLEAKTSDLDKNTKSWPAKVEVQVRDYGAWTLEVKTAVQNKKPSLKLGEAVVLKGAGTGASVTLYSGKKEISCKGYTITKTEGEGVALTQDADGLKLTYTGTKAGSYKVKVRKDTWADGAETELKGKISVLDIKKAKLGADLSKVTINITEGYSAPVTVNVGIKGSGAAASLTAKPEKDKDAQALTTEVLNGGKIRIIPKDGAKKGTYKVAVSGSVNGEAVKGLSIKVTLTDKAPAVKLSAKGQLNLANREGTSILYTPALKNLPETISIKAVRMDKTAADSGFFQVKLAEDGKVVMTTVTGKTMNPKTKYKPVLIFTLSNGKTLRTDANFTVKVTNKLPKVSVTTLSGALCGVNARHRASYKLSAGNGYTISNVTTNDTNCKVTFDGRTNTVYVSLSDGAAVAAGKKYTVPCTVYIKGADNTTKPLTVKLKAVVY